ncbi:MAG: excinuclease ABC subunit A [Bacteroidales bacterium]|nr:excinuclease ABC subunit A [Bacteroidales bacterium]
MAEERYISLNGVRVNNLKNISLKLDLNTLTVVTGVSGSGKSSLAFDTLYAEGQRRYVESLSSYARQFLGRLNKPECDSIIGIPPSIAIEQKVNSSNPRSTVGTLTEIYDYLKLLYARTGKTISPISGKEVRCDTVESIRKYVLKHQGSTAIILTKSANITNLEKLTTLSNQGYVRLEHNGSFIRIDDVLNGNVKELPAENEILLVVDRITVDDSDENKSRLYESIEGAVNEGNGECIIMINGEKHYFSNRFEADGIHFEHPSVNMFSFNSPIGACPKCNGYGKILGIDENLVVPNKSLSVYDNAVMCWRGEKMSEWKKWFILNAHKVNFPIHKPYYQLSDKEKDMLWNGFLDIPEVGINATFADLERHKYKIQNRVMIARYTGKTICPECHGTRLKPEASYVKVGGKSLPELVDMSISELIPFFKNLQIEEEEIASRIMPEITSRLEFMQDVGLEYLTLNRLASTLSGGESQRVNLATSLGSALVGSLYVLDEPSIGLHARDSEKLIRVLKRLRDIGNTVVVVEHDEEIMCAADKIIDIGPLAGAVGGEVVYHGDIAGLKDADTLTADYLYGRRTIDIPKQRREFTKQIVLSGATENNLKNITVHIPLRVITAITGVSGSGKSTLVKRILVPALSKIYGESSEQVGSYDKIEGDVSALKQIEFVDQHPIGKSSRSNPVTYIKAWDDIRKLFADQKQAKMQGFKPSFFSFNVSGGRCDMCEGEGVIKVSMQFMADMFIPCEQCHGKRFKDDILEIKYRGKSVYDILEMTVDEALGFFSELDSNERSIVKKLKRLKDVGLEYVKLGQPSNTLSGGESQRVKLAYHLSIDHAEPTLFVFDEPTTGLHFHDIHKLMKSFDDLIHQGHSIVVIEHNLDVIRHADYIIDLGPEGGDNGGNVMFEGTPEALIANCPESYTAQALAKHMNKK